MIVGLLFMDVFEGWLRSSTVVAGFMIAVGVWFLITEIIVSRKEKTRKIKTKDQKLNWAKSFSIGIFQAVALIPGVSRSGMTISAGMCAGLSREKAARFSFLLSAPVILAAGILGIIDMGNQDSPEIGTIAVIIGFAVSAVVGFLSITWLMRYLRRKTLYVFALYLIVVGGILVIAL